MTLGFGGILFWRNLILTAATGDKPSDSWPCANKTLEITWKYYKNGSVKVCCAVFPEYGHPILLGETFPLLNLCHKSAFDLLINKELNNIYNIGIWRDSFLTELDLYDRR